MYGDLAHNLLARHVYGFSGMSSGVAGMVVQPTLIRLPGYPLFLAGCFAVFGEMRWVAVIWVQIVLDLVGCGLLGVLAGRLWGRRAGLVAVWLAALCPFTANYAVVGLAESLSVFCVVVVLFGLERWVRAGEAAWGWVVVIGCAQSWAVLLRPDQGLLAAVVVPVMLWVGWRSRGVRGAGPAVVASLIVMLPLMVWAVRNWRVFHVVQPLAPRYATDPDEEVPYGFQRWFRTWAVDYKDTVDIYWSYDDTRMSVGDLPARAFDDAEQRAQTAAVFAQYNSVMSETPEFDAAFARIAAERVRGHALRYYVELPVAREMDMWLRPRLALAAMPVDWWAWRRHPWASAEEMAYALLNAVYLGLAVWGLVLWRRRGWSGCGGVAVAMVGFVVLRCVLLLTLDNSEPRYTLECFPVVILLAALAVASRRATVSD